MPKGKRLFGCTGRPAISPKRIEAAGRSLRQFQALEHGDPLVIADEIECLEDDQRCRLIYDFIWWAYELDRADLLEKVLHAGLNPNSFTDRRRQTRMIMTAATTDSRVLGAVIEAGADVQQRDIDGSNALHYAVLVSGIASASEAADVVVLLVSHAARVEERNRFGQRPIDILEEEIRNFDLESRMFKGNRVFYQRIRNAIGV
jgi:hypothetical protein